jgi:hypothetical protein
LLRRGDYRNKGYNTENLSWVRVLVKMVCVARKIITIEWRKEQHCVFFGEEITGTKVTKPKIVLGSSFGEDVGLGIGLIIIIFFYDIQ